MKFRAVLALFCAVALAMVHSFSFSSGVSAQNTSTVMDVDLVIQGGTDYGFPIAASKVTKAELSLDMGLNWTRPDVVQGQENLTLKMPRTDTFLAQARLTLTSGAQMVSNLFSIDSTAPKTSVYGRPYTKGQKLVIPHEILGYDTAGIRAEYLKNGTVILGTGIISYEEAMRDGFMTPDDGVYDIRLIAVDGVENVEQKATADIRGFRLDREAPKLTLNARIGGYFLMGGDKITVDYGVTDANLVPASLRLQLLGDGRIVSEVAPLENSASASLEWTAPYANSTDTKLRLVAMDSAGNVNSVESESFVLFAGRPMVIISDEDGTQQADQLRFHLAFTHQAGLEALRKKSNGELDYRVDIYEAIYQESKNAFEWQVEDVARDNEFEDASRKSILYTTTIKTKGYAARLVVGTGNNRLSEPVPNDSTAPESIFRSLNQMDRARLNKPNDGVIFAKAGAEIHLGLSYESNIPFGAEMLFEYSSDGGSSWNTINASPFKIDRNVNQAIYTWKNPPTDLKYALVRAVTQVKERTLDGVEMTFRVMDLLDGGVTVDGSLPQATLLRVTDEYGRTLSRGDYTNSRRLRVYWQANDEGTAGMQNAILYDNRASSSVGIGLPHEWSNAAWEGPDKSAGRILNPTAPYHELDLGETPEAIGNLGLLIEAIDIAGNRRFTNPPPVASYQPDWNVNVDRFAPSAEMTATALPDRIYGGETIELMWDSKDDFPESFVTDSLGPRPVSIWQVTAAGRFLIYTGLPASGSQQVVVQPFGGDIVHFEVTARDRAGNVSPVTDKSKTKEIRVRRPGIPVVTLTENYTRDLDLNQIKLEWMQVDGDPEDLEKIQLWVREKDGVPFAITETFLPGEEILYSVRDLSGKYDFALTATSKQGMKEPPPATPELTVIWDKAPPELQLELSNDKKVLRLNRDSASVRIRVRDAQFDPNGVELKLIRNGSEEILDTSSLKDGEWLDIPIPLTEVGNFELIANARDAEGNSAPERRASFSVIEGGSWIITSFTESETYYCRSRGHLITWESSGFGAGQANIDLAFVPVRQEESGVYIAVGERIVVATRTQDDGVFEVPMLPTQPGAYKVELIARPPGEDPVEVHTEKPFFLKSSRPFLTVKIEDSLKVVDGRFHVLQGVKAHPVKLSVRDEQGDAYELLPASMTLKFRRLIPDGAEEWKSFNLVLPKPDSEAVRTDDYSVDFLPPMEGRYEISGHFIDILGFATQEADINNAYAIIDAGPPDVAFTAVGEMAGSYTGDNLPLLRFEARDQLLDPDSIVVQRIKVLDVRQAEAPGEWETIKFDPADFNIEEQRDDYIRGTLQPKFEEDGTYYLRIIAKDLLGQESITNFGRDKHNTPIFVGEGRYVATSLLPVEYTDEEYVANNASRLNDVRIFVFAQNPWPEGLRNLSLWWRRADGDRKAPWEVTHFEEYWHVYGVEEQSVPEGESLPAKMKQPTTHSLPFRAPEAGIYEFIVTSVSNYGNVEMEGEWPDIDAQPELVAMIDDAGYGLTFDGLNSTDTLTRAQRESLENSRRVRPGSVYEINWEIHSPKINGLVDTTFELDLSLDGGENWIHQSTLSPGGDKPELFKYTETLEMNKHEEVIRRKYTALWKLPDPPAGQEWAPIEDLLGMIRIRSQEDTDLHQPFARSATAPRFRVGAPAVVAAREGETYYNNKMKEGREAVKRGDYQEGVDHFLQAMNESNTHEVNHELADAYEALGDDKRAAYHRKHAKLGTISPLTGLAENSGEESSE